MKNVFLVVFAVLLSSKSFADTKHYYSCSSYYWNASEEHGAMRLIVGTEKASAKIFHDDNPGPGPDWSAGGELDASYSSRGKIKFIKFGPNLFVEQALLSGGRKWPDGSVGGIARFEGSDEGEFCEYKFVCRKRGN